MFERILEICLDNVEISSKRFFKFVRKYSLRLLKKILKLVQKDSSNLFKNIV